MASMMSSLHHIFRLKFATDRFPASRENACSLSGSSSALLHQSRRHSRNYSSDGSDIICKMISHMHADEVADSSSKMESNPLLTPYKLGPFQLSHRVVYAPLTRRRSLGSVPQPQAALYYSQRTSHGGLLISEATCIMDGAYGSPNVPGIHTRQQIEAWKPIVQAVHDKGGIFFCQLWHVGRASHYEYQPNKAAPVSSTSNPVRGRPCLLPDYSLTDFATPRPLRTDEIPKYVQAYALAARNAREAGFDGVEIHAANGYLLDQFMKDRVNDRTDQYGSQSLENRCRFTFEVINAVADEIGAERVGIRFSPFTTFNDSHTSDPTELGLYLARQLDKRVPQLVYLHYIEPRVNGPEDTADIKEAHSTHDLRRAYSGTFMAAGGFTRESGMLSIGSGHADLIAYGRTFLANPDLPRRFELNAPLNPYNRETFYIPDPVLGYTDYPLLTEEAVKGKAS